MRNSFMFICVHPEHSIHIKIGSAERKECFGPLVLSFFFSLPQQPLERQTVFEAILQFSFVLILLVIDCNKLLLSPHSLSGVVLYVGEMQPFLNLTAVQSLDEVKKVPMRVSHFQRCDFIGLRCGLGIGV